MLITYDEKINSLKIECKIWENDLPRKLPNRKFSNRLKAWVAPCVRFNARIDQ